VTAQRTRRPDWTLSGSRHRPFRWRWRSFEYFAKADGSDYVRLLTERGKRLVVVLWALVLGCEFKSGASRSDGVT
jgi:hypothetical protein